MLERTRSSTKNWLANLGKAAFSLRWQLLLVLASLILQIWVIYTEAKGHWFVVLICSVAFLLAASVVLMILVTRKNSLEYKARRVSPRRRIDPDEVSLRVLYKLEKVPEGSSLPDRIQKRDLLIEKLMKQLGEPAVRARVVNLVIRDRKGVVRSDRTLRPHREYEVLVNVGGLDRDSLVHNPTEFPDDLLKPYMGSEGLPIQVVISSKEFELQDREQVIILPPEGPSETVRFRVRTPLKTGTAQLRVVLYFRGNALQSLLVTATISKFARFPRGRVSATVEYCLSGTMKNIETYSTRAVNILTNESTDGTHTFSVFGTGIRENFTFDPGSMKKALENTRNRLLDVCAKLDKNGKPSVYRYDAKTNAGTQEQFVSDICRLADIGSDLYLNFAVKRDLAFEEKLRSVLSKKSVIQISSVKSANYVFPWAIVYDKRLLTGGNTVCPTFLKGLENISPRAVAGERQAAVAAIEAMRCLLIGCPNRDDPYVVCPSGFWGLRHIIEQPPSVIQDPESFPRDVQTHITVKGDAHLAMGVSLKLDGVRDHIKEIKGLPHYQVDPQEHKTEILTSMAANPSPDLIYLYCHGGTEGGTGYLGVGDDDRLVPKDLFGRGLKWPVSHPLVFINGCHTADLTPDDLLNFVNMFTWCQASGVIGTEVSIPESLAREFALGIFKQLTERGVSVGDAIRAQRLFLLGKYNPLGLVYTPYCYADLHLDFQD
jgi:hypothetical protein